jgi:hypothetical protein
MMKPAPQKTLATQQMDQSDQDNWQRALIGIVIGAAVVLTILLLLLIFLFMPSDSGKDEPQVAGGEDVRIGGNGEGDAQGNGSGSKTEGSTVALGTSAEGIATENAGEGQSTEGVAESSISEQTQPAPEPPAEAQFTVERLVFQPPPSAPRSGGATGVSEAPLTGIFEVPEEFKNVVYVIDKSGSMDDENRLVRVKAELIAGIQSLKPEQEFSVVFFDSVTWPMFSQRGLSSSSQFGRSRSSGTTRLLLADDDSKSRAIDWINGLDAGGGTVPLGAMLLAMKVNPDMIMFLSDGEFDRSYVTQISATNQKKRGNKARIDCIGLGKAVRTLQAIAQQNDGIYHQAR